MNTGRRLRSTVYLVVLFAMLAAACGPSQAELAQTVVAGTATARASEDAIAAQTQAALDKAATATQQLIDLRTATQGARETAAAERVAERQTATAEGILTATAQAQPMVDLVNQLVADGYLTSAAGEYARLEDFDESEAKLNYYFIHRTDYDPVNFVFRTDASWDSASDSANWPDSGCGILFRYEDIENHYFSYFGLDGASYLYRKENDRYTFLGRYYYGRVDTPRGGAEITLVVTGNKFTYFINGTKVGTYTDSRLGEGGLALTIYSGTNAGFGTRCQMRNIDLWILDE